MRIIENGNTSPDREILEIKNIKKDGVNNHTDEYWTSGQLGMTREDWIKEEEQLNRGHKACESFSVLNELVVVYLPFSKLI
jgi:hypothetical protein